MAAQIFARLTVPAFVNSGRDQSGPKSNLQVDGNANFWERADFIYKIVI